MTTPKCKDVLNLIPLYVDNLLDKNEYLAVKEHISLCPDCKRELDLMLSIMKKTKELPEVKVSADFSAKVVATAKLHKKKINRTNVLSRISSIAAVAAVMVICVVSYNYSDNVSPESVDAKKHNDVPIPQIQVDVTPEVTSNESFHQKKNTQPLPESKANVDSSPEKKSSFDAPVVASTDAPIEVPSDTPTADVPTMLAEVEPESFTIATVELTEENAQTVDILTKDYEKDDFGYIVPDMELLLENLSDEGITVQTEISSDITNNYVIVK